jgi:hypothetical protein
MNEKSKGNGHRTETPDVSHIRNVEVTHETSDVSVRGVLTFVVVLTISGIAIHLGVAFLYNYFNAQEAKEPGPGPMALKAEERLPPEPRLQSAPGFGVVLENGQKVGLERAAPQDEYKVLRKQWDENLKTGLKDQSGNVVGMPIDAAIDKVAAQGLPSRVKGAGGKLTDYAVSTPTAWSSGRETEKRLQ